MLTRYIGRSNEKIQSTAQQTRDLHTWTFHLVSSPLTLRPLSLSWPFSGWSSYTSASSLPSLHRLIHLLPY